MGLTLLVASLLIAAGQTAQPPAPQTFESATQLVEVDVRVFQGERFVGDLKPAEFELTEDGVPQQIRSVLRISAMPSPPEGSTPAASPGALTSPGGAGTGLALHLRHSASDRRDAPADPRGRGGVHRDAVPPGGYRRRGRGRTDGEQPSDVGSRGTEDRRPRR